MGQKEDRAEGRSEPTSDGHPEMLMREIHYHDLSIMHDSLHMYVSKSVITSCVFRKERVASVK